MHATGLDLFDESLQITNIRPDASLADLGADRRTYMPVNASTEWQTKTKGDVS